MRGKLRPRSIGVTEDYIRVRAYQLFEERGRHDGYDVEDWLQAEAELIGKKQPPEEPMLEKISRRRFVTTAAVAGASAVLGAPSFAFENQSTDADGPPEALHKAREVATLQAVPFRMSNVRLRPGPFSTAAKANRRYLKTLPPDRLL